MRIPHKNLVTGESPDPLNLEEGKMYIKGSLKFTLTTDTQTENYDQGKWAHLPHSCDNWVIGGKENIEWLIEDLKNVLKRLEEPTK